MKRLLTVILGMMPILSSCELITQNNVGEDKYYINVIVTPLEKADTTVLHDAIIVPLPWGEEGSFKFRASFDEVYGPYETGEHLRFLFDTPNLNTFRVQLKIRKGEDGNWLLAAEAKNQLSFDIPEY